MPAKPLWRRRHPTDGHRRHGRSVRGDRARFRRQPEHPGQRARRPGHGLAGPCATPCASPSSDAPGATHSSPCREAGSSACLNAAEWPHCQLSAVEKIKTAPSMVRIMGTALPRAFTMMSKREATDPHQPHWHIGPVGVRPELQGHGIGKSLLESFLAEIDERREPAFLETDVDRNVTLYEKLGFTVTSPPRDRRRRYPLHVERPTPVPITPLTPSRPHLRPNESKYR